MANENNNINELVSDEDPTAELEVAELRNRYGEDAERESHLSTFDAAEQRFTSDESMSDATAARKTKSLNKTISKLKYDLEQANARQAGLQAEIDARQQQSDAEQRATHDQKSIVSRKQKLIKKRDQRIKDLKKEIRDRDKAYRDLLDSQSANPQPAKESTQQTDGDERSGVVGNNSGEVTMLLLQRDQYADTLRHRLQDRQDALSKVSRERDDYETTAATQEARLNELEQDLRQSQSSVDELNEQLSRIDSQHQEDIRILRFELGEAQETMAETEGVKNRLTSDLVEAHSEKSHLEQFLSDAEERAKTRIDNLQIEVERLASENQDYKEQIAEKSEAVTILLNELSKKSEKIDLGDDTDNRLRHIDGSNFQQPVETPSEAASRRNLHSERITRMLVGSIDGQLLRFPLFKDKLTIGRTESNDIQLKAAHISRRHAVLQTDKDTTRVIDWGSKNGVYVNAERVTEHFLSHGDIVTIGNAHFRYEERKKREN